MTFETIKEKGRKLLEEGKVLKEFETDRRVHFKVIGEMNTHFVIFDKEKEKFTCDCHYFTLQRKKCSHILAAEMKKF